MADSVALVLAIVLVALAFDFINGFHDSANSIATVVSTRVLSPTAAVVWAAFFNFAAVFIFGTAVAKNIAKGIVDPAVVDASVILAGLVGAISWNLITWYAGLPSSSSHALIGGIVGATLVAHGTGDVLGEGLLGKVIIPALVAPTLAVALAGTGILAASRIGGRLRPGPVA